MPIPSSERRLTRSQVRLGRAELSSSSPSHGSSSPCKQLVPGEVESAYKASIAAERGRRKVLADLAGNDSPIVGLIPGLRDCVACRTPFTDLKSAMGTQSCTKKPSALADEFSGDTPIGESLLRSQVQLLLQKVEADAPANHKPAPSLRALCHLQSFMDSPALKVVAPTPINTPCSNPVPNSEHAIASRLSLAEKTLSVQTSFTKPHNSALNIVQSNDRELLVQSPMFQDKLRFQEEQAAVLRVNESGIKLLVDLNISPDAEAAGPSQSLSLRPKSSENSQITITESVVSGRDHQIMQISPLISEVLNEADETEILGKKTTRILQFDSPDKTSATEISCTSIALAGERFSSMREVEEDGSSEWSVLVNVSSPEAKHDEAEVDGEDSADSANSFSEEEYSVHDHLLKNRLGSNKLELLWSVRRKGIPFRKGAIEDEEEEEEESSDYFYSPQKEQEEYGGKLEQCQNLFSDLTFKAEKGERK